MRQVLNADVLVCFKLNCDRGMWKAGETYRIHPGDSSSSGDVITRRHTGWRKLSQPGNWAGMEPGKADGLKRKANGADAGDRDEAEQ